MAVIELYSQYQDMDIYSDSYPVKPFSLFANDVLSNIFNMRLKVVDLYNAFKLDYFKFKIKDSSLEFQVGASSAWCPGTGDYDINQFFNLTTSPNFKINGETVTASVFRTQLNLEIQDRLVFEIEECELSVFSSATVIYTLGTFNFDKPVINSLIFTNINLIEQIVENKEEINTELDKLIPSLVCKYQHTGTTFEYDVTNDNLDKSVVLDVSPNQYKTYVGYNNAALFDNSKTILIPFEVANLILTNNPSYFYSEQSPLVVPPSGLNFTGTFSTKIYNGNTLLEDVSDSIQINRSITYTETLESGGLLTKATTLSSYEFESTYTQTSRTFTNIGSTVSIYANTKKPISLKITGSDTNVYYQGRPNLFKLPNGLSFYLVFNDGTEESLSSTTSLHYRESQNSPNLTTSDYLQDSTDSIVVELSGTYESENYQIFGSYQLNKNIDQITRLEITYAETIILGNYLKKDDLTVKATYSSGAVVSDFKDFSIISPTSLIMSDSQLNSIILNANGHSETISSYSFSTSVPEISNIVVSDNIVTVYNNNKSKINLLGVVLTVHYQGAEYTENLELALTASTTKYGVVAKKYNSSSQLVNIFTTESLDNYNGTNTLNISELEMGSASCEFVFSVLNHFDTSETETFNVSFKVLAMTAISGLQIKEPYTEYHVGDTFLNENDNTVLVIYWVEDGALMHQNVPLKSGYDSIAIYPEQGTEFKNVDSSKQITVKSVLNSQISAEYTIQVLPRNISSNTKIHDIVAIWQSSVILPNNDEYSPDNGVLVLYDETDTQVINGVRSLKYPSGENHVYGYVDNIFDEYVSAKVVMFDDYLPEIDGAANMEITYPCYAPGEADIINKCTFGILFGANNSVNRLFVSGNNEIANADWHTHELNLTDYEGDIEVENGNFSYIPAESVMYYGETDNAVIGYDIVSNDKLLVLKNKSDKEKTVYFRVPITVKAIDASGSVSTDIEGNVLAQEEFGLIKGNNSVAGISPTTILNFNGDTLFIDSDNQLSGLDLTGIIGDNQRYANSRSKLIDFKLKDFDLSSCTLWTNNKYLFLSIPDVGIFVTHFETKTETQYEWWYLCSRKMITNEYGFNEYINSLNYPTTFIEIDGEIYFGNETGNFIKLFNGRTDDIKSIFAGKEQISLLSFDPDYEKILCDSTIIDKMDVADSYKFKTIPNEADYKKNIYYRVCSLRQSGSSDLRIDTTHNTIVRLNSEVNLYENKNYFLNYLEEDLPTLGARKMDCAAGSIFEGFGTKFRLIRVDAEDSNYNEEYDSYYVYFGNQVTNVSQLYNAALCERLSSEVDVVELDKTNCTFRLAIDGELLNIVSYGTQDPSTRQIRAEIREFIPVEGFFISAPMLASNLNVFKTIHQITMTNDTGIPSTLQVGIASNKIPFVDTKTIAEVQRGDLGINFNDLNFNKADFEKTVVPRTYTISKIIGMQKFICFAFKNEKGNNAVLSEMAVTYTLPFPSYGSD